MQIAVAVIGHGIITSLRTLAYQQTFDTTTRIITVSCRCQIGIPAEDDIAVDIMFHLAGSAGRSGTRPALVRGAVTAGCRAAVDGGGLGQGLEAQFVLQIGQRHVTQSVCSHR